MDVTEVHKRAPSQAVSRESATPQARPALAPTKWAYAFDHVRANVLSTKCWTMAKQPYNDTLEADSRIGQSRRRGLFCRL